MARSVKYLKYLAMACLLPFALHAQANDAIARIGAGGIELLKTDDVRMLEEQLDISPARVHVRYRFMNEGKSDLRTTVAFPMPPYGWNAGESASHMNVGPMRSFVAKIDGQAVRTEMTRAAVARGKDITVALRSAGLTDVQIFDSFGDATIDGDGLSDVQRQRVRQLTGNFPLPGWQVAETLHWEQTFPAGREVVVEHDYQPLVGMVFAAPIQKGFDRFELELSAPTLSGDWLAPSEACIDDSLKRALDRRLTALSRTDPRSVMVTLHDVEYILGTGRNWRGPIGEFILTIEKQAPDDLVSLCFPGKPNRISPTRLQFRQSNFVPQDKLVVYFYSFQVEN